MSIIDDALPYAAHGWLADPVDHLRGVLVELSARQMLVAPGSAHEIAEQARSGERTRIRAAVEAALLASGAEYPDSPCALVYRQGLLAALRAIDGGSR